ncbi:hypothetical protein R3P38DRAFT_2786574 [Favolaschia claudopus]|uniref:Uncharacterized protein n=1 Tax=Favolaschia claudopus TaxID=2862362 RepID=A0AAW0AQJ1_9AGAR
MAAFTHWVLAKTACQLAFTDLQDHGPAGIQDTIDNHKCSMACQSMDLASMASLKMTFKAAEDAVDDMEISSGSESEEGDKTVGRKDPISGYIVLRQGQEEAEPIVTSSSSGGDQPHGCSDQHKGTDGSA